MTHNKLAKAVRLAITLGTASTLALSSHAFAEDQAENEKEPERVAITGSKIKRIGEMSPTPVTVVTGDALVNAGITNVAEILAEMPSSTVGLSPETTNNSVFANGLSNTDLRGLGTQRTLVLVNGRRFVAGAPGSSAVDLNNIPTAMIERIEITTGGASAVYGSDAMAGVVNIVTKKSFDGFEFDMSTSRPSQSGGDMDFASFTFGNEGERSSFIGNISWTSTEQLRGDQRDFIRNGVIAIDHPDNVDNEDGIPRRIIWDRTGSTNLFVYSPTGDFFTADGHYIFADDGSIREFQSGEWLPASSTPGSRNTNYFIGGGDGYSFLKHKYVRTPLDRLNLNANYTYEINDSHTMGFELTYSNTHAYGESSPAFYALGGMRADNAFFSDETKDFFSSRGMSTYTAYITTDALGNRVYDQKRKLMQGTLSFAGELYGDWTYDAYFQRGNVQSDTTWYGEMLVENFNNALDAVEVNGQIVCADRNEAGEVVGALAGCSPLNIWGVGLASQEALDYVKTDATRRASIDQTTFGATVTGDVYELPAGPIAAAFSFEHRKEASSTLPDPAMRNGLIFNNQSDALKGNFDVTEMAAEFSIPLVSDTAYANDIYLETAYRHMDYSSTGKEGAWKVSLNYVLNDDVRFRVNRSKSVRAPNITELFAPNGETFSSFNDPCAQGRIDNAGEYKDNIEANCRAQGIPEGWEPSEAWKRTNHSGFIVGNQDLDNESAHDITVGVIYTPAFIENFSITVDYWKFEFTDLIRTPNATTVINGCYEFESLDNPYCPLIVRNPETREIDSYFLKPVNSATNTMAGTDIELNYTLGTEFGDFRFNLMATYLEENDENFTGQAADQRNSQGEVENPRWKARFTTNYTYNDLQVNLLASYRHASVWDNDWEPEQNNYNDIPSYIKWDLSAHYNITEELQVRGGVFNLFDVEPPRHPSLYDDGEFYDLDGRTLKLGVNYSF